MDRVLDGKLLNGTIGAERHLRVPRFAWSLSCYPAAEQTIELMCEQMGAVSDLLVPEDANEAIRPWYTRIAATSVLDGAVGDTARRLVPGLGGNPFRRPPALIELGGIEPERRRPVHVVLPALDNPWHMAYLTAFGALAARPNNEIIAQLGLRQDLQFDEFLNIARMTPTSPGAADLAARLTNSEVIPPLYLSLYKLTRHPAESRAFSALDGWLDDAGVCARNESSSIVVVYTPGDVADLCLAWNLRAIHGWGNRLPLAIPYDEVHGPGVTAKAIGVLVDAITSAGMRPTVSLVSESVDQVILAAIVRELPGALHGRVYVPDQLLVPATPPSRTSASTVVVDGLATIPTRTDHHRHQLSRLTQLRFVEPDFQLTVNAHGEPVIECPLLRCEHDMVGFRHSGGGPSVDASSTRSSWRVGRAGGPSSPPRAAVAG